MSVDLVAVYADESCLGNGREGENPGGAGGCPRQARHGDEDRPGHDGPGEPGPS